MNKAIIVLAIAAAVAYVLLESDVTEDVDAIGSRGLPSSAVSSTSDAMRERGSELMGETGGNLEDVREQTE